eukprot:COSAG02_NODE_35984_length_460_cov_1.260388_1_plen_32_part_01
MGAKAALSRPALLATAGSRSVGAGAAASRLLA